jgi:LacI family transcriptional regulator
MSCNDYCGQNIIEACKDAGIHIPEEIAVLGSDDDYIVCDFTNPKLSSISYDTEKAGYEAAKLLDKLMKGEQKMTGQQIIIHPVRVVTRQSTDILAVEDEKVAEAIRFINQHCNEPIQVGEVADAVAVLRRSLERRFKVALNRTIHDEIRRVHIDKVVEMLLETNLSVLAIAMSLGYHGTTHISRMFRQERGMTLRDYRKKLLPPKT